MNLDPPTQYKRPGRILLCIKGADRAKFLHNVTTNEVKRLRPGEGREAFVTSLQGKTLAYVQYHVLDDEIIVRADEACRDGMMPHFAKYGVFDEIEIEELTESTDEVVVWSHAPNGLGVAPQSVAGLDGSVVVRDDPTGRGGVTWIVPKVRAPEWAAGTPLTADAFEALRIQAGTPVFGKDVGPSNLPQEVGRDPLAINFVKGCYLGQETVARLDALGHVNRLLLGLVGEEGAPPPAAGSPLRSGVDEVGVCTSSAWSPALGKAVGLAYLRAPKVKVGDRLTASTGEFTVAAPPISG